MRPDQRISERRAVYLTERQISLCLEMAWKRFRDLHSGRSEAIRRGLPTKDYDRQLIELEATAAALRGAEP